MKQLLRRACAVAIFAAACAPNEISYKVNIVTQTCGDSTLNPFESVSHLRVRVTGPGIESPLEHISSRDTASREMRVPQIPAGSDRVVEVRAYDGDPTAGGRVVSVGRSLPITVPDRVPEKLGDLATINVFLRKVNAFSPPSSANSPTQCQRLRAPRAGHTATLLANGRVFVAGGFNLRAGGPDKVALASAEIYNTSTGAFEPASDLATSDAPQGLPRAFHSATALPNGQVLLWGGETYANVQGSINEVAPNASIIRYDPESNSYGSFGQRSRVISRTQHAAAIDANGKVLVVGGKTRKLGALEPVDEVEWFDPAEMVYRVLDNETLRRIAAAVVPVKQGELIAVAGGAGGVLAGSPLETEVVLFKFDGASFRREPVVPAPRLAAPGRRAAGAATLRDGHDLLLLGGYTDPVQVRPLASSEVLSTQTSSVLTGPTLSGSRGDVCAVALSPEAVMGIGGRTIQGISGPSRSDTSSVIVRSDGSGGLTSLGGPTLRVGRYAHTCTRLLDGTVLVLGGINESSTGGFEVLQDAWIYQPAPND